ncbi:MAG: hypothetical protein ABIO94_08560 [Opitutaceae bacterium]
MKLLSQVFCGFSPVGPTAKMPPGIGRCDASAGATKQPRGERRRAALTRSLLNRFLRLGPNLFLAGVTRGMSGQRGAAHVLVRVQLERGLAQAEIFVPTVWVKSFSFLFRLIFLLKTGGEPIP